MDAVDLSLKLMSEVNLYNHWIFQNIEPYLGENILEIGCGTGYSTYYLLSSFFVFQSCNINQTIYYYGIDLNKERIKQAKDFINTYFEELIFKKKLIVNFIPGNAIKIIPQINEKFDLIFIDAAKFEYPLYLEAVRQKLQNSCIIIADNIFYSNKIFSNNIPIHDYNSVNGIKEFIRLVLDKRYFETIFINVGDGLSLTKYNKSM